MTFIRALIPYLVLNYSVLGKYWETQCAPKTLELLLYSACCSGEAKQIAQNHYLMQVVSFQHGHAPSPAGETLPRCVRVFCVRAHAGGCTLV